MGIPTWLRHASMPSEPRSDEHPVGFASRVRRRRDSNPDHGRDRAVCSPDYTTSACCCPGRSRTGDPGASRSRSYRCGMRTCGSQNARRGRSRSLVPLGTNGDRTVASHTRDARLTLGSGLPDEGRRRSRVPQPRTGSPCGGQVMRGSVSGTRRIASHSRNRHRRSPSGCRPDAPCAGGGTRRTGPRLSEDEHAAV
jgi:hypothetical protein